MAKQTSVTTHVRKPKVKRPNVHAKSKTSKLKTSKNYVKLNKGQGWTKTETNHEQHEQAVNVRAYVKTERINENAVQANYKTKG